MVNNTLEVELLPAKVSLSGISGGTLEKDEYGFISELTGISLMHITMKLPI